MANSFYGDFDVATYPVERRHDADDHRSTFQVDRDRVLFSYAFRRLQSKTQVFQSGEYDFYRTRLTHSIEVARIGRSICDLLRTSSPDLGPDNFYIDPDLVEAIGLAHDLGHPPFGHIGERKLNDLMGPFGGFEGNAQTARLLTETLYERDEGTRGMLPTRAFIDGVMKYKRTFSEAITRDHETGEPAYPENHFIYDDQLAVRSFVHPDIPADRRFQKSIECQIMDWADDTAYSLHDMVDGAKAGFITPDKIELWIERMGEDKITAISPDALALLDAFCAFSRDGKLEARFSNKVGSFIRAASLNRVEHPAEQNSNRYRFALKVDPTIASECKLYKALATDLVFKSPQIQQLEFKGGRILGQIFDAYFEHYIDKPGRHLKILPERVAGWIDACPTDNRDARVRLLCDHIAGLTDGLATRIYKRLFNPDFGSIIDLA